MGCRWARTLIVATLPLAPGPALAQADVETGRALAERWCGGCHLVGRDAGRASDAAPPFTAIAGYPNRTAEWLFRRVTVDPHPVMPNLNLTLQEARDLNAYLDSLAAEPDDAAGAAPSGG